MEGLSGGSLRVFFMLITQTPWFPLNEILHYPIFWAVPTQRELKPTGIRKHTDGPEALKDLQGPSASSEKNENMFTVLVLRSQLWPRKLSLNPLSCIYLFMKLSKKIIQEEIFSQKYQEIVWRERKKRGPIHLPEPQLLGTWTMGAKLKESKVIFLRHCITI
jgi:hypothetical protein